eukprot:2654650-Amphidinium_carterae.1
MLQARVLEDAIEALSVGGAAEKTAPTPKSIVSNPSFLSNPSSDGGASPKKRDVIRVNFDLDDKGHKVLATVEFFRDGSVSLRWTAEDLPCPLPYIIAMVHEVDLLGEIAPYIETSSVVHQFPWSPADRIVRVVSKPPIPLVSGVEA